MKNTIRVFFKILIFVFFFLVLFFNISNIFRRKENWRGDFSAIKEFYKYKKKSFDVIFLGTSHTYAGISNWKLWNDYGIASYNFANSFQSFPLTYFMLEEAIRQQTPKLVVVDLFGLVLPDDTVHSLGMNHNNLDYIHLNKPKVNAINALVDKNRRGEFFCSLIEYHSRWSNLKKKDFLPLEHRGLGSDLFFETRKLSSFEIVKDYNIENMNLEYFSILEKMINLCKSKKVDLLFTILPYHAPSKPNGTKFNSIDQQRIFNKANNFILTKNAKALNLFHCLEEISFDWNRDMRDSSHLNISGANKVTSYIGKYIKENYSIPDRRSDSQYKNFEAKYELYKHEILGKELRNIKDFYSYINFLAQNMDKYLIIISGKDTVTREDVDLSNKSLMEEINLNFDVNYRESYIALINQGNLLVEKKSKETLMYKLKIDNLPISVMSSNWNTKNIAGIKIDGIEKRIDKRGLSIVVYDKKLKDTIDSVVFDIYDNAKCYR